MNTDIATCASLPLMGRTEGGVACILCALEGQLALARLLTKAEVNR